MRVKGDLHHLDTQVRMIQDRSRGRRDPASGDDVADLAQYVRRLVKIVEGIADRQTSANPEAASTD
jgi:hypothetical protein